MTSRGTDCQFTNLKYYGKLCHDATRRFPPLLFFLVFYLDVNLKRRKKFRVADAFDFED